MKGRIENDLPVARATTDLPTARVEQSALLEAGSENVIKAGTPIGLLLSLTYANQFSVFTAATFKGLSPTARIRTT